MNNITIQEAQRIIKSQYNNGEFEYPSFSDFFDAYQKNQKYLYARVKYNHEKSFDNELLQALLVMGTEYHKLKEKEGSYVTPFGILAIRIRDELQFRYSLAGEKAILRNSINQVKILEPGKGARDLPALSNSKQNQFRLQQIQLLENENNSLRKQFAETKKICEQKIDTLKTEEECEAIAAKEVKQRQLPALFISWLTMPIYTVLKSLEFIFDSIIVAVKTGRPIEQKLGGSHPVLGRIFGFPAVIAFYIAISAPSGEVPIGYEGFYLSIISAFVMSLISIPVTIVLTPVNELLGDLLSDISINFSSSNADDVRIGNLRFHYNQLKYIASVINENEQKIEQLRALICNNTP